ncbi:MAG: acetate uptake transporter, partial [Acetobacter sp.]|nr:acetate uptake transporter [Acetobacter sp.]
LLICILRMTTAHQVLFSSLSILFFLLAFKEFTGSHALGLIAGYEGMFSAASGMYLAVAEIFESSFGQTILPIGKPKA